MCTPGLWSGDTSINIITNALIHSRVWSAASAATIRCPSGDRVHPCCTAEAFAVNFYQVILLWHLHYQVNTIFNVHVSVCATLLHHIDQHTGRRRCLCHLPYEHNPGVQKQKKKNSKCRPLHQIKILVWSTKDKSQEWRVRLKEERMKRERNGTKWKTEALSFKCFVCVCLWGSAKGGWLQEFRSLS